MKRIGILILLLALTTSTARADKDPHKAARAARTAICRQLEKLANDARNQGDAVAAQALAETYLWVAGVPHPWLDAIRRELNSRLVNVVPFLVEDADRWSAVLGALPALVSSARAFDNVDAALVRRLPGAIAVARRVNAIRTSYGLKRLRFDARRSIRNIEAARTWCRRGHEGAAPTGVFLSTTPWLVAVDGFTRVPSWRAALLAPDEKGFTIGGWSGRRRTPVCVGVSRNLNSHARKPVRLLWPQDGAVGTSPAAPLSVHFFRSPGSLEGATAELSGGKAAVAVQVSVERHVGQIVAVLTPDKVLEAKTTYRATLRRKDGKQLARWSFTTR